ncbi:MAG: GntR family transcriptional regulator [Anaerolineae bacterium]
MASIEPVQHIQGQVVSKLRQLILNGHFLPGDKLYQEDLAAQLGISVIPVREGLMQLHTENLVDFIPRRGAFVKSLSIDQVEELYYMREELEALALRWVIPRLNSAHIEQARRSLFKAEQLAQSGGDLHQRVKTMRSFYLDLFRVANRPYLYEAICRYYNMIYLYLRQYIGSIDLISLHRIYRELMIAIESGDIEGAIAAHRRSHDLVRESLIAVMRAHAEEPCIQAITLETEQSA